MNLHDMYIIQIYFKKVCHNIFYKITRKWCFSPAYHHSNLRSYSCHIYGTSSTLPTKPFIPRSRAFMRRCCPEIIQSRLTTDDTSLCVIFMILVSLFFSIMCFCTFENVKECVLGGCTITSKAIINVFEIFSSLC